MNKITVGKLLSPLKIVGIAVSEDGNTMHLQVEDTSSSTVHTLDVPMLEWIKPLLPPPSPKPGEIGFGRLVFTQFYDFAYLDDRTMSSLCMDENGKLHQVQIDVERLMFEYFRRKRPG